LPVKSMSLSTSVAVDRVENRRFRVGDWDILDWTWFNYTLQLEIYCLLFLGTMHVVLFAVIDFCAMRWCEGKQNLYVMMMTMQNYVDHWSFELSLINFIIQIRSIYLFLFFLYK
jgi:hypothetical protein